MPAIIEAAVATVVPLLTFLRMPSSQVPQQWLGKLVRTYSHASLLIELANVTLTAFSILYIITSYLYYLCIILHFVDWQVSGKCCKG